MINDCSLMLFSLPCNDDKKTFTNKDIPTLRVHLEEKLGIVPIAANLVSLEKLSHNTGIALCSKNIIYTDDSLKKVRKPSEIPHEIRTLFPAQQIFFFNIDFSFAFGSYAYWENDKLIRSFSADIFTIFENIGLPNSLEQPFWAKNHPIHFAPGLDPAPTEIPFHPIELAQTILQHRKGFSVIPDPKNEYLPLFSLRFTRYHKTLDNTTEAVSNSLEHHAPATIDQTDSVHITPLEQPDQENNDSNPSNSPQLTSEKTQMPQ